MQLTHAYDHFYRYDEITSILKGYEADFPQLCRLSSLATTPEGRSVWLLEITNPETGGYSDKPAYFVNGNIHTGEVTGSMVAMGLLDSLFTGYQNKEENVLYLLDHFTFYVVPRITPDGSECYLTTPDTIRSANRMYPYSKLMPGLQPKDMDGDGVIRKMRIKSPYGAWKVSDRDPRLMTKRRPDEVQGEFYDIYTEGEILEFDGVTIKSAPQKWGQNFNRNFPSNWMDESIQSGSGAYPLSNVETRAMADFVISHKNICCALEMHTMTGMYLYPPSVLHKADISPRDLRLFQLIGEMATEETGYPVVNVRDDYISKSEEAGCAGTFNDFNFHMHGIIDYTVECWDLDPRAGVTFPHPVMEPQSDQSNEEQHLKYLQWIDRENDGEGAKPWTKFNHPQLGEVEIGGIDYKYVVQNPPLKFLRQEVEKHVRFMLREANRMPQVSFRKVDIQKIEDTFYQIDAYVMNTGFLPTQITEESFRRKIAEDLEVTLEGEGLTFISGKQTQAIGQLEGYSAVSSVSVSVGGMSSERARPSEKKVTWIVKAAPGTHLTLTCKNSRIGCCKTESTL